METHLWKSCSYCRAFFNQEGICVGRIFKKKVYGKKYPMTRWSTVLKLFLISNSFSPMKFSQICWHDLSLAKPDHLVQCNGSILMQKRNYIYLPCHLRPYAGKVWPAGQSVARQEFWFGPRRPRDLLKINVQTYRIISFLSFFTNKVYCMSEHRH